MPSGLSYGWYARVVKDALPTIWLSGVFLLFFGFLNGKESLCDQLLQTLSIESGAYIRLVGLAKRREWSLFYPLTLPNLDSYSCPATIKLLW